MAIEPYNAIGLIPVVRGITKRADIQANLDHIASICKPAHWLAGIDYPIKLITIPEGALQGFNHKSHQ